MKNFSFFLFFLFYFKSFSFLFENNFILFEFNLYGSIIQITDKTTQTKLLTIPSSSSGSSSSSNSLYSLWEITFVDLNGDIIINNLNYKVFIEVINKENIILNWNNITIQRNHNNNNDNNNKDKDTIVNVKINLNLKEDSLISNLFLSVDFIDGLPLGIWQSRISIPFTIGSDNDGELFFPSGFGTTYNDPIISTGTGINSLYPGGYATMQFMAIGSTSSSVAGYFAAHDGTGSPKFLEYTTNLNLHKKSTHLTNYYNNHNNNEEIKKVINPISSLTEQEIHHIYTKRSSFKLSDTLSFLSITIYPENSGVQIPVPSTWNSTYPLAFGIVRNIDKLNNRPLWYEAAMIYRNWVLKSAEWTKLGPLSSRTDITIPSWFRENHLWLNTHWQCHDIFNETGGDPNFVIDNTKIIAELFNQKTIALHWYEWQQGPDPTPEGRYKFDTHYPDYFPPRNNFYNTVSNLLKESGIHTFPYINGRIFDIKSDSYLNDNGEVYCAKKTTSEKLIIDIDNINNLESYIETYGSDASFCVANPITNYWQDKVTNVVDELINKYNVSGVYIDQIGAATPKLCWDSTHNHTLGGGKWWRKGYIDMLQKISLKTSLPMVTEDNAEPYMDGIYGYLTLVAFKNSLVLSNGIPSETSTNYRVLSPAYPAIYGGYYIGFGAQWYQLDFNEHNWWCSKLASTFVTGTQLGWYSLLGVTDDPLDSCGNMAVNDYLLNENNTDLIEFLKKLTNKRQYLIDYFIDGYLIRPISMNPLPQILTQTISTGGYPLLDYDTISTSSWKLDSKNTVTVILIGSTIESFETTLTIDFNNWNYDNIKQLNVYEVLENGEKKFIQTLNYPIGYVQVIIPGRDIMVLDFQPK